jgi:hypothetical protein
MALVSLPHFLVVVYPGIVEHVLGRSANTDCRRCCGPRPLRAETRPNRERQWPSVSPG